jgi:D-3-phosphoglycerate dehydrogenase
VDDQALLQALRTGRLAGAAVDVVSGEHGPARTLSPLITYARRHNNLVVTPHIGGCTGESMEKTEIYMAQQVAKALAATQPGPVAAAGS